MSTKFCVIYYNHLRIEMEAHEDIITYSVKAKLQEIQRETQNVWRRLVNDSTSILFYDAI